MLPTLMEVSIATVGFAAIFGVLSVRSEVWPVELRFMFRALIEVGLMAVFVSAYPLLLESFGIIGDEGWFYSSVLTLITGVAISLWRIYLIRTTLVTLPRQAPYFFSLSALGMVLTLGNVVFWRSEAVYLTVVCLALFSAFVIFLTMIYSMFPIEAETNEDTDGSD